jgi:hypothetical protein
MTSACGFGIMIGWLCKLLVLKYGGPKPYQRLRPLFLGFILGQICGTGNKVPVFSHHFERKAASQHHRALVTTTQESE